ncbi:MAG: DUF6157 family protein [Micromonosporaceae bacterium]
MDDMNYYNTLIAVADDCPITGSVTPAPRGGKKTVAVLQYEMLAERPNELTQEEVLFESWWARQEAAGDVPDSEVALLRKEFFAKPQACLRASPLPKKYGWGLLFDERGTVALCPMESAMYRDLVEGGKPDLTVLKAMRSSRK